MVREGSKRKGGDGDVILAFWRQRERLIENGWRVTVVTATFLVTTRARDW
jgi:hypothetical protein